ELARPNVGSVLLMLLRKRGAGVVPYVMRAATRAGVGLQSEPARQTELIRLADERGWLELWTRLLQAGERTAELQREIARLLDDQHRDEREILQRLETIARLEPSTRRDRVRMTLSDDVAVKMYGRFPSLLRVVFRPWLVVATTGYSRLLDLAIRKEDEALVDFLAGSVVLADVQSDYGRREIAPMVELLVPVYERLAGAKEQMAQRAVRVLGCVPAGAPGPWSNRAPAPNALCALLCSDLDVFLSAEAAAGALLESPNAHGLHLAFRSLARDDPRARSIARDNLPTLKAALVRDLPRPVRMAAVEAMENAGQDVTVAADVIDAARQVCAARRRPDDAVLMLIARLLHRHPSLRTAAEAGYAAGSAS
ncbi:MAG: DUF732 domain-containing protein, partial [Myxococcota bacterium]